MILPIPSPAPKPKRTGTTPATVARKKKNGLCERPFCGQKKGKKKKFCDKHHQRAFKEKNFLAYTFHLRKSKATSRAIPFTLTLPQFTDLVAETDYLNQPAAHKKKLSIDRKNADRSIGYTYGNCRVIPLVENSRKGAYERADRELPAEFYPENCPDFCTTELPF